MWSVNKGPLYFLRINGYVVCALLYIARPNYACNLIVVPIKCIQYYTLYTQYYIKLHLNCACV